tara:strand:+ start:88937 stop:89125 length:189 start_codon:yes stop_codon:yes gene_type:complete
MSDIVAASSVSRISLYKRFPTKEYANGLLESAAISDNAKSDVEFLVRIYIDGLRSRVEKHSA